MSKQLLLQNKRTSKQRLRNVKLNNSVSIFGRRLINLDTHFLSHALSISNLTIF